MGERVEMGSVKARTGANAGHRVTVGLAPVHFPFEPYQLQMDYMDKLMLCFKKQGYILFPDGTSRVVHGMHRDNRGSTRW
ncbi:hypothetical protein KIPB_006370 [Kipferlia bialata]|uniref:Uncharacterized protein n=1 Tax=Kipferlia bialata TaxID=797122 RepID=A0A9K3CZJ5_9EUKA|nr:hypothetical protein KIPB_006370 [Kipferlia bialata]|eukprot:g6370.t1